TSGCKVALEGLESMEAVRRRIQEESSENLNKSIVEAELARLENFKGELGFAHKIDDFQEGGTNEAIVEWALAAKTKLAESDKKWKDFRAMVGSQDKWSLEGTYQFLLGESMLKKLQSVGQYDNLNRNVIVTVSDNGRLRPFVCNDGVVSRTNKLPGFCRSWRIVTGGRSGISYGDANGFFPDGGYRREDRERENHGPPAKRRWGRGGGANNQSGFRGRGRGRGRGSQH
ncbi:unnamed protein product, partial [Oikopleura dioica]